ncbi:hypothetical protein [Mycolicibacter sinensis]|uniref:Uncharacterized protein n=1 Tax=Mycolicibacter sinensis (strain JDM601) TaxID=875328 RepID=A0A1A2E410_MYCSD|nr:hypothetical protein [Mycolicibacter sinensis]OBF98598.1 hypothetical protein A5772_14580 [Mycolicibacter sinensis]OBF99248.1 hypothetical protein A5771_19615 [Mycolicibacter sinensis]
MDAERFRQLLTARAPFISVYFEDSHDTEDAATKLELTWREVSEQLTQQGVGQRLVEEIERAHTLRADEALPWGAIAIGAAVVGGGEAVDPADGVAAVLRYPPTASA